MKKIEESLYIKILVWSYEKQESGFYWEELEKKFELNEKQKQWVLKVFRSNTPSANNLIDHFYNSGENQHLYFITDKGTSVAIDYLNLKEAQKNSRRAEKIALWAIAITAIVGIIQITADTYYK